MDFLTKIKHALECDECEYVTDNDHYLEIEYCWRISGKWHGPLTKEQQERQDRTIALFTSVYENAVVDQLRVGVFFGKAAEG